MTARTSGEAAENRARIERAGRIRAHANQIRRHSLRMIYEAGQGHPGGDLSAADVLAAIYFGILRYDPNRS